MDLLACDLPGIPKFRKGKVREVFDLGENLLIVATDRISAFDFILPNAIPHKGEVLTQISAFWFEKLDFVPNHLVTAYFHLFPENLKPFKEQLAGRSMIVRKPPRFRSSASRADILPAPAGRNIRKREPSVDSGFRRGSNRAIVFPRQFSHPRRKPIRAMTKTLPGASAAPSSATRLPCSYASGPSICTNTAVPMPPNAGSSSPIPSSNSEFLTMK